MNDHHTNSATSEMPIIGQSSCAMRADAAARNIVQPGWDVAAISSAWNCTCRGDCSGVDAAQCLYRTTLELVSAGENICEGQQELLRPLVAVVGRQTTRAGQDECRRFANALNLGETEIALSACHRLIAIERECLAASDAPVRIGERAGKSA